MPRPNHIKLKYAIRLGFKESDNEMEYEILISRLKMAGPPRVKKMYVYSDS